MKDKHYRVGAVMSLIAGFLGVAVTYYLFIKGWKPLIAVEIANGRPDEGFIVTYVLPMLTDLTMIGGALWLLAAVGFFKRAPWTWTVAVVASVLSLSASFFPSIPMLSRGLPPTYFAVFLPNLVFFFALLCYVNPVDRRVLWLSFLGGMTAVLCFMNGVASMSKAITTQMSFYVPVQQLCWVAALAWGIFTAGLILRKVWAHQVGLLAGILGTLAGFPLAALTTVEQMRPSMFTPGPALAAILFVVLLTAWFRRALNEWCG